MKRIRIHSPNGYLKEPPPYSVFLIRQGMEVAKEAISVFGVKQETFYSLQQDGAALYGELRDCIVQGHTGRALSVAYYLKELLDYAAYAGKAARKNDDEHRKTTVKP